MDVARCLRHAVGGERAFVLGEQYCLYDSCLMLVRSDHFSGCRDRQIDEADLGMEIPVI